MIWVDALCINQNNIKERGVQVAKMGQIYEQCSRVIVYLGADIISSTGCTFPMRHPPWEIERELNRPQSQDVHQLAYIRLDLRELLKRNYFNRVWVIQELIFSQRAVIHVGNSDFWTDSIGTSYLSSSDETAWDWDSAAAPWIPYMAQKAFPVRAIFELLHLTSNSRASASDPRDRLFSVLDLMKQDDAMKQVLQVDYSLSAQHAFIGLFAHFIISLQLINLFLRAAGPTAPSSSPSWIPNWTSQESWQHIFTTAESVTEYIASFVSKRAGLATPPSHTSFGGALSWRFSEVWKDAVYRQKSWNQDISVDITTGALSIHLMHICAISSRPALVHRLENQRGIFEVKGGNVDLYLGASLHWLAKP
jgi:hypothetical protein